MQSQSLSRQGISETIDDNTYRNLDLRGTQTPIPDNLDYFLNSRQLEAIDELQDMGWDLMFVRRPLFNPTTVVVKHSLHERFAVVEEDGFINLDSALMMRA